MWTNSLLKRRQKNRFVMTDQFLPLNAGKAAYKFIAYFLPYIIMSTDRQTDRK